MIDFVEGTRFTEAKHTEQKSPYRHLLKPKIGGLGIAMPFELWNWAEQSGAPTGALDAWRSRNIRDELQAIGRDGNTHHGMTLGVKS